MFDLIIIGAGPAGVSGGVYASRKKLKTLFVTKEWGGQSTVSPDIQNWIGTPSISGDQLAKDLENHLRAYATDTVEIKDNTLATKVEKQDKHFVVTLESGEQFESIAVLIASGSKRRRLPVLNADDFENKGLTYCATCDGPIFAGQDVVVIGGGNAGFETAAQLLAYTKSVTLIHRGPSFKADPVTIEKVLAHENMTGIFNADTTEIMGDQFVSGLKYKDNTTNEEKEIAATGIFVEIGMIPNTELVAELITLDEYKRVEIDPWTQRTSVEGIWAAGDCTNVRFHQNNISAGDAVKALEDIYLYVKTR